MIKDIIAQRYGKALFELASQYNLVDQIDQEIGSLTEMAFSAEKYHSFWENPVVEAGAKMKLLESILGIFQVSKQSESFLRLLINKGRFGLLPIVLTVYRALVRDALGITEATVVSAVPLETGAVDRIRTILQGKLGGEVRVTTETDATLLGGVVVKIGNNIVDGSAINRLRNLQDKIQRGSAL